MNDDPYAERPSVLASLEDLDVGPVPVRDIVNAGHRIKRRRRATLAGIAAATVLVIGGGLVTTQVLGSNQTDDSLVADSGAEEDATADGQELSVEVTMVDGGVDYFLGRGAATWIAESRTISYVSLRDYSSSCRPKGTATQGEDGVTLDLRVAAADGEEVPCAADARIMVATISGLEGPPDELVVTEEGETRSVAVSGALTQPGFRCADGKPPAVSMYDQAQPPPGVTLEDVVRRIPSATIVSLSSTRAVVAVVEDGVLKLEAGLMSWPNGSWSVERETSCR